MVCREIAVDVGNMPHCFIHDNPGLKILHYFLSNCKYEGIRGDKHSCCGTPSIHTATLRGVLSGDIPRS